MAEAKGSNVKKFIILGLFCALIIGAFAFLANRRPGNIDEGVKLSVVQQLLSRNLSTSYPPTPKEVVKLYSEYTRCFYGEPYTDEELEALAIKSRELLDDELVATQTDESFLVSLKSDIERYKAEGRSISSYSIASAADVEYDSFDGYEWARLSCYYSMKVGKSIVPVHEKYLLRKDFEGHWKIVGWELAQEE
ncbi:MAG TPA: hypothetical protein DCL38_00485 [Lachnospiraceae bacterium]|nr:hypothetical protein [Lachnospiraceae bacterium]